MSLSAGITAAGQGVQAMADASAVGVQPAAIQGWHQYARMPREQRFTMLRKAKIEAKRRADDEQFLTQQIEALKQDQERAATMRQKLMESFGKGPALPDVATPQMSTGESLAMLAGGLATGQYGASFEAARAPGVARADIENQRRMELYRQSLSEFDAQRRYQAGDLETLDRANMQREAQIGTMQARSIKDQADYDQQIQDEILSQQQRLAMDQQNHRQALELKGLDQSGRLALEREKASKEYNALVGAGFSPAEAQQAIQKRYNLVDAQAQHLLARAKAIPEEIKQQYAAMAQRKFAESARLKLDYKRFESDRQYREGMLANQRFSIAQLNERFKLGLKQNHINKLAEMEARLQFSGIAEAEATLAETSAQIDALGTLMQGMDPESDEFKELQSAQTALELQMAASEGRLRSLTADPGDELVKFGMYELPRKNVTAMVLENAKQLAATSPRYRLGASGRNNEFDCSQFVQKANQGLFNVPGTTAEMWDKGQKVPQGQMVPGDIIIFHSTMKSRKAGIPSHCGIYAGNGRMIHMGSKGAGEVAIDQSGLGSKILGVVRF